MALLVPIERLVGRSARDEEFLFNEKDGDRTPNPEKLSVDAREQMRNTESVRSSRRIVACENIRSAFNVGSIFRTCETFSGDEVWLTGYTPDPLKTAMGTDALLKTQRFERTSDAILEARKLGFTIVALENSPGAVPLEDFAWPEKSLVILGNERFGVDSQTLAGCDSVVRIATSGLKNSLNVGTAFGIAAASWRNSSSTNAPSKNASRSLTPIGFLRGGYENPQVAPRQGAYTEETVSTKTSIIELEARFDGRPSNFDQALNDLAQFERAWIIFEFDRSEGWNPQVRPPRGDGQKRGMFATRSPHRPNRLGLSCVRIKSVEGRKIEISEHDLLEGTPIFDIKPYVPLADAFPNANAGWIDDLASSEFSLSESATLKSKIDWLEAQGETRLRGFINEQLRYQPFDQDRKRVELASDTNELNSITHAISFRTWRIHFLVTNSQRLELVNLSSRYSDTEISAPDDIYGDKDLHRAFRKEFP
jgi:tRNA-Thr(GGU) m(6)t(6)A37 methyltransferase TsaA